MDVADKKSVANYFSGSDKNGEKIDICINNAGIEALTLILEDDEKDYFESIIQTNLMGAWYVAKAIANHMKSHGIHVINIGGINGECIPATGGCAYSISETAVVP